jgi:hypothetical protein
VDLVRAAGLDLDVAIVELDDHDRALIRRCLTQVPAVRLAEMVKAVRSLDDMSALARA